MASVIGAKPALLVDDPSRPALLGAWAGLYPALSEYMTKRVWAGGEPRLTSTLNVSYDEGVWKAVCNDRDLERSLWVSAESPEKALQTLELQLVTGAGEWRSWGQGAKGKRKK